MTLRIAWYPCSRHRQILPILAGLLTFLGTVAAEPDPGRVDAFGRTTNRIDHSVQYILPDPNASSPSAEVSPLASPSRVRAIESFRTIRDWFPDGSLIFRNGRKAALLGCKMETRISPALEKRQKEWRGKLRGKVVRLVFDEHLRNASGELAAYVFLGDGTLLNEVLLREGLCVLDTRTPLSPQYSLRFKAATEQARSSTSGLENNASAAAPTSKLPEYIRGFTGLSPRASTSVGAKRTGQDQSP